MPHHPAEIASCCGVVQRYHLDMAIIKRPGASLLLIGLVLFFLVRPVIGSVWLIGGILAPMAWVVGLLAIVGGGYLLFRSQFGSSR